MGIGLMSRSGGEVSLWYEAPTMTLLPGGSFPAGLAEGMGAEPPAAFEGKDRAVFGSRRTAFEILATWALLAGTKTTTARSKTVNAMRVQRARLAILVFRRSHDYARPPRLVKASGARAPQSC